MLIIGSGFGNFSRVIGPWQDYNPAQLAQPDSQFDIGVGTEIVGGTNGATITAITMEPPFNVAGNVQPHVWRCAVIRGKISGSVKELQEATLGWPRRGDSEQKARIIWSKLTAKKVSQNNYAQNPEPGTHFDFPDLCGPAVGPGEIMTVIYVPLFNESGAPVYGAGNFTYLSLSVFGVQDRRPSSDGNRELSARSIPRNRI